MRARARQDGTGRETKVSQTTDKRDKRHETKKENDELLSGLCALSALLCSGYLTRPFSSAGLSDQVNVTKCPSGFRGFGEKWVRKTMDG